MKRFTPKFALITIALAVAFLSFTFWLNKTFISSDVSQKNFIQEEMVTMSHQEVLPKDNKVGEAPKVIFRNEAKNTPTQYDKRKLIQIASTRSNPRNIDNGIQFDGCSAVGNYSKEGWYSDFLNTIKNYEPLEDKLKEGCLALNEEIFIFMEHGEYLESNGVYKYDIVKKSLEKASVDGGGQRMFSFKGFGQRQGGIVSLDGGDGDAGCFNEQKSEYFFVDNIIKLKEQTSGCHGADSQTGEPVLDTETIKIY